MNNIGYLNLLAGNEDDATRAFDRSIELAPRYYSAPRRNRAVLDGRVSSASLGIDRASLIVEPRAPVESRLAQSAVTDREVRDTPLAVVPLEQSAVAPATDAPTSPIVVVAEQRASSDSESVLSDKGNEPIANISTEQARSIQRALAGYSLYSGQIDGQLGDGSLRALRLFKVARRLPVNDSVTRNLLTELDL